LFKVFVHEQPLISITSLTLATLFISAYILRILERPYWTALDPSSDNPLDSYLAACWLVINTMTLMGLSDVRTSTPLGKCAVTFICIAGTFLISLLIAATANFIILTAPEERALIKIKNDRNAMKAIVSSLKFRKVWRKRYP
jgi:hypothetical protein